MYRMILKKEEQLFIHCLGCGEVLRDWLGKLSSEAPAVGGESDERASSAIVDEQAVEQARKVAEWETVEVDQVP